MKCSELMDVFEKLAPQYLAESWDNTGLLVGRKDAEIKKALIALDATDEVIDEALECGADIIVTHHPMIFGAIKQVNDLTPLGRRILKLAENDIAQFAMHTNLDIAFGGVNDELAKRLGLKNIKVLEESCEQNGMPNGFGRYGDIEETDLKIFAGRVKNALKLDSVRFVGNEGGIIKKVGLCSGAGVDFMEKAKEMDCDVFVTSDFKYHESQRAQEMGIALIDATHYGSENIIVDTIYDYIKENANDVEAVKSRINGQVFKNL